MRDIMRGWCVIPIKYRSKEPEVKWEQYQKERPSRQQVMDWFSDGKDHNIGIVTGQVSGGLVVLVFNRAGDFERFFEEMDILKITPIAMSLRGQHVYLHVTGRVESHLYDKGRFEVKGEGTYVVAPPSIHPSGIQYRWLNPEVRDRRIIADIDDFEEWLKERALKIGIDIDSKPGVATFSKHLIISPETVRPRYARELVSEGERNSRAFRVACYFFKHYRRDDAEKRTRVWAYQFCENFPDDSFTLKALEATIASAYKAVTGGKLC